MYALILVAAFAFTTESYACSRILIENIAADAGCINIHYLASDEGGVCVYEYSRSIC